MSAWTSAGELKNRLEKEWDKGRLLAVQLSGERLFPLRVPLKQPTSRELGDQYGRVKAWIDELVRQGKPEKGIGYEIEWREVNHRQLGKNRLPVAAVFEQAEDGVRFIGREKEAGVFRELCRELLGAFPELKPWLESRPLTAVANAGQWPRLLAVLRWLKAHPRPGIYIRQLEISQVDTKFVERHKRLLGELLDIILPAGAIDECAKGVTGFEQRYGFLAKPVQIRFHLLDPNLYIQRLSDLEIPAGAFAGLDLNARRVFITENNINGLAFPSLEKSIVIFGLGYGLDRLARAGWLHDKEIYYWGDIDTHGFAMLDQIRLYFPKIRSFLMDSTTLMAHQLLWGSEESPVNRALSRLNRDESAMYKDLTSNRWARALRLEQEQISYTHLKAALESLE
jgi:hypothetical protein